MQHGFQSLSALSDQAIENAEVLIRFRSFPCLALKTPKSRALEPRGSPLPLEPESPKNHFKASGHREDARGNDTAQSQAL